MLEFDIDKIHHSKQHHTQPDTTLDHSSLQAQFRNVRLEHTAVNSGFFVLGSGPHAGPSTVISDKTTAFPWSSNQNSCDFVSLGDVWMPYFEAPVSVVDGPDPSTLLVVGRVCRRCVN